MTSPRTESPIHEIRFHRKAIAESEGLGLEPADLAAILRDAWTRLRTTRGSKLRALSGTSGKEFRLRVDSVRAIFSVVKNSRDRTLACVHLVAPRSKVYQRPAFGSRISHFYESTWDRARSQLFAPTEQGKYSIVEPAVNAPTFAEVDLEFDLYEQQQSFFDSVLPFRNRPGVAEPLLIIGYGPPGSGKTIVGCQLITEAWRAGHDVDVLVPSTRLRNDYAAHIALQELASNRDDKAALPSVGVFQFDEYFARLGRIQIPTDRFSQVQEWWFRLLSSEVSGSLGRKLSRRVLQGELTWRNVHLALPIMLDALIEDEEWISAATAPSRKDFLAGDLIPLTQLIREHAVEIRNHLHHSDLEAPTRGALASTALRCPPDRSGKRLLLVDEAQDMAPAEWRALLHLAFAPQEGLPRQTDWRVVMLGDMRQRVSLVPFDWDDVKSYAYEELHVPTNRIVADEVDAASYRMGRRVAEAAVAVFDSRVAAQQHIKQHGRLNLEQLDDRGAVTVLILDIELVELAGMIRLCQSHALEQENLQIVYQATENDKPLTGLPQTFCDPVMEVKGLEYESVIVIPRPLAGQRGTTQTLSGEDSTELYTAMTRAREKVLLLVTTPLWTILQRAAGSWDHASILKGEQAIQALPAKLREHRVLLDKNQLREALLARLERMCDARPEDPENWQARLLETARRLAGSVMYEPFDVALDLSGAGLALLQAWKDGYELVRTAALRAKNNGEDDLACTLLVLLGETALAADIAERAEMTGRAIAWSPMALEMCRNESRLQAERSRRGIQWIDAPWTSDVIEQNMFEEVTKRLVGIRDARSAS